MIILLQDQLRYDMTIPPPPVNVFTGSALPLHILGIPSEISAGKITALSVTITNANGVSVTAPATRNGNAWDVTFAASNFTNYGKVTNGISYTATVTAEDDTSTSTSTSTSQTILLASGILDIRPASASAQPGEDSRYQKKGDDEYIKSEIVDGVQHYKKVAIAYDAEMAAWGFNLEGDYILSNGSFVPANQQT